MKIQFREEKSIITKNNILKIDYAMNSYTGCNYPFFPRVLIQSTNPFDFTIKDFLE